ncbi:hypothetical protein [Streptomyces pseudovenezuelae]|uniref:hypothetical protein n=1 Tax=Streptomyces pseudovenezuelae TaxID=67350 RepID=UPI0036E2E26A
MKRCTESFTIWRDGAPVGFVAGQLVEDKHPILKTHGHLFAEPVATAGQAAAPLKPVEEATANPGEQRTLTPPTTVVSSEPTGAEPFDPAEHTIPQVLAYLKDADDEERARVLDIEAAGEKRKGILGDTAAKE